MLDAGVSPSQGGCGVDCTGFGLVLRAADAAAAAAGTAHHHHHHHQQQRTLTVSRVIPDSPAHRSLLADIILYYIIL